MGRVTSLSEIVRIARALKRRGKRVVTVNGSFDLLHPGHLILLAEAKRQGDVLIVLMNSDASVRRYKGPGRPFNRERDRVAMLAALKDVDYVTLFNALTPIDALSRIRPTVHVNGADWGIGCVEQEVVERYGGIVKIVQLKKGFSSTGLMRRICAAHAAPVVRAVFVDRDGTINHHGAGYVSRREDFRFLPYVLPALKRLSKSDYKIIVVTNQSGIGRGFYTARAMHALHGWLKEACRRQGIRIDAIYHCPHLPEDRCTCRKPQTGLVLRAVKRFGLSLSQSWMVGDSEADVGLGRAANMKTIKMGAPLSRGAKLLPHHYADNLQEAVRIILRSDSSLRNTRQLRQRAAALRLASPTRR